jgi:YidC/Oxa1 family membrane protein insertase
MINFFKITVYIPLYNLLILTADILPTHDAGLAIVLVTVFVKFITYPLSKKAVVAQFEMKKHEPELALIKEKFKDNKEKQAVEIMAFYKKYKINPFSSIFMVFIQIPVIYSLYHIFLNSGLPIVNIDYLYSFIPSPANISMMFLGFIDVSVKNIYLALLAGTSSYYQIKNSSPTTTPVKGATPDFASMMTSQMKYTFPVIVFFISWKVSGAVALYWLVSNLFTIAQDYYIKRKLA